MINGQCPKCKNLTLQEEVVLDSQIIMSCPCGFTDQGEAEYKEVEPNEPS